MVVACRVLAAEPGEDKASVTNVVFMGMGGEIPVVTADLTPASAWRTDCNIHKFSIPTVSAQHALPLLAKVLLYLHAWLTQCVLPLLRPAEPLDNLDSVMAAVDIMTHPLGLHMSKQKVGASNRQHPSAGSKQACVPISSGLRCHGCEMG